MEAFKDDYSCRARLQHYSTVPQFRLRSALSPPGSAYQNPAPAQFIRLLASAACSPQYQNSGYFLLWGMLFTTSATASMMIAPSPTGAMA